MSPNHARKLSAAKRRRGSLPCGFCRLLGPSTDLFPGPAMGVHRLLCRLRAAGDCGLRVSSAATPMGEYRFISIPTFAEPSPARNKAGAGGIPCRRFDCSLRSAWRQDSLVAAVAHRFEEIVERLEAHEEVAALLIPDSRARFGRIGVSGIDHCGLVQIAQFLIEAVVHLLGVRARQIDPPARADKQRIA